MIVLKRFSYDLLKKEWREIFKQASLTTTFSDQRIFEARTILLKSYPPLLKEIEQSINNVLIPESQRNAYDFSFSSDRQRIIDFFKIHYYRQWGIDFYFSNNQKTAKLELDFKATNPHSPFYLIDEDTYIKRIKNDLYDDMWVANNSARYPIMQIDLTISTSQLIKDFEKIISDLKIQRQIKDFTLPPSITEYRPSLNDLFYLTEYIEGRKVEEIAELADKLEIKNASTIDKQKMKSSTSVSRRVTAILNLINIYNEDWKRKSTKEKEKIVRNRKQSS